MLCCTDTGSGLMHVTRNDVRVSSRAHVLSQILGNPWQLETFALLKHSHYCGWCTFSLTNWKTVYTVKNTPGLIIDNQHVLRLSKENWRIYIRSKPIDDPSLWNIGRPRISNLDENSTNALSTDWSCTLIDPLYTQTPALELLTLYPSTDASWSLRWLVVNSRTQHVRRPCWPDVGFPHSRASRRPAMTGLDCSGQWQRAWNKQTTTVITCSSTYIISTSLVFVESVNNRVL